MLSLQFFLDSFVLPEHSKCKHPLQFMIFCPSEFLRNKDEIIVLARLSCDLMGSHLFAKTN